MARVCENCEAAIPWGAPRCVECGSITLWQRWLSNIGILLGAGTALVVIGSMARVWLMPTPPAVRAAAEIDTFVSAVSRSQDRALVRGAGRCKASVAEALCVQTTPDFADLDARHQQEASDRLEKSWSEIAELNPRAIVLVGAGGEVLEP